MPSKEDDPQTAAAATPTSHTASVSDSSQAESEARPLPALSELMGLALLRLGHWPVVLTGAMAMGVVGPGLVTLVWQVFTPAAPLGAGSEVVEASPVPALPALLWLVGLMAAGLTGLGLHLWLRTAAALRLSRTREDALAWVDDMTGVRNRRAFMEAAVGEWGRARRYGTNACLLLVDADHFMQFNDRHGHLCGDELLRHIAAAVQASLRQADILGRFGGSQFAVFLPHTETLGALDVAERIRVQVEAVRLAWLGHVVSTTVSVGVAPLRPELPTLDWMVHEAETALMAAKAEGRNRVRALAFQAGAFDENQAPSTPR